MGWHPFAKQASRERQLEAELRFHLEQRISDNVASGMSPVEARRRALLEFGSLDRVKEECRALHWETAVESLYCDFRYTLRLLARDVRFSILAILALGLGIGSATVIFSAVYGVILNSIRLTTEGASPTGSSQLMGAVVALLVHELPCSNAIWNSPSTSPVL